MLRYPLRDFRSVPRVAIGRPSGWQREVALRFALAIVPCTVLIVHLPAVLGRAPGFWVVPLAMTLVNAWMIVSVAREILGRRAFLVFWALYGAVWTVVAWHGLHFHGPPRPAALLMNLGEISHTPLPDWSEIPWGIAGIVVGLGYLARRPSSADPRVRFATLAALTIFLATHAAALLRYRTGDMLRYSEYRDLVRTQGLEGAAVLDGLDLLRTPNTAHVLRDLRAQAAKHPPAPIPLEPVASDRMVILQLESLDRDAITPDGTPTLQRLWDGATHGLVDPLRTSVSGSSSADFQLLTGLPAGGGVPVYKLAWDGDGSGLPARAASRRFAFHAYHGNDAQFWNRGPFFAAIGASFHAMEDIPKTEYSRWGLADGDLFRFAAGRIRTAGRAVHFLITLSTHAPFDLVDPAAHLDGATQRTRYFQSVAYLDGVLGKFLEALPRDGTTLVVLYGDHTSNLFGSTPAHGELPVPLILGRVAPDGSLAPLASHGRPVRALPGTYEFPAVHRYLEDCLDASAP